MDPVHPTQSVASGPVQEPHVAWQSMQTPLLFAYLPSGVHDATQVAGSTRRGEAVAHVRHSLAEGPSHVLQVA